MLKATLRVKNGTEETIGDFTSSFMNVIYSNAIMTDCRIYAANGDLLYTNKDINNMNIWYEGELLKSILKVAEFEFCNLRNIDVGTEYYDIQIGVSGDTGKTFYYVSLGKFIVASTEQNIDNETTKVMCYDEMCKSMKTYGSLGTIEYNNTTTNYSYLQELCSQMDLDLDTDLEELPVMQLRRNVETYNEEFTYRDVIDDFSEILCGCMCIKNRKLTVLRPTATGSYTLATTQQVQELLTQDDNTILVQDHTSGDHELEQYLTIDEEQVSTITIKEPFRTITTLILSRSPQNDNAVLTKGENGETVKIDNNLLVDGYQEDDTIDRTPYLEPMLKELSKWGGFYSIELQSFGYVLFEPCDRIEMLIHDRSGTLLSYPVIWTRTNLKVSPAISEEIESFPPQASEGMYVKSTTSAQQDKATYIYVNKQDGIITNRVQDVEGNVTLLQQDVNDIRMTFVKKTEFENIEHNITFDFGGINLSGSDIDTNLQLGAAGMFLREGTNSVATIEKSQFTLGDWIMQMTGESFNIYKRH